MFEMMMLSLLVLGAAMFRVNNLLDVKNLLLPLFFLVIGFSLKVAVGSPPALSQAAMIIPVVSVVLLILVRRIPSEIIVTVGMMVAFYTGALLAGDLTSGVAAVSELAYSFVISAVALAMGMQIRHWILSRQMMKRCHEFNDCTECEMFEAHSR